MTGPAPAPKAHWISPSILAADFARLGEEVANVLDAGADTVHFDVMDNHYVPNLSIGASVLRALREYGVTAPVDVHLMVRPVDRIIGDFIDAGADYITFHPDATASVPDSIKRIHGSGAKAGLALSPGVPVSELQPVLEDLDLVLVMSVVPGFGGQSFMPESLDTVRAVRRRLDDVGSEARLEIDGGINVDNVGSAARAGADMFVAGTAIFGTDDYAKTIESFRSALA
ncbi:MAG: ribulose-phosphate 3-epimerase [Gammaproteobacteria bacterium]|nr:ribulose-phosphate 3-epimerase [Gammaproteobacteria bacterium]